MDLPPSGWYPDPYGTPDLLRWWDGSNWTRHTHPAVDAADTGGGVATAGTGASGASGNFGASGNSGGSGDGASGYGALGGGAFGNGSLGNGSLGNGALGNGALGNGALGGAQQGAVATTVQPATAEPTGGGWAAGDRVIGDWAGTDWPTGEQLAATKPPKGPRTEPQPALPNTTVQPSVQSSAQATRYQPAVQATTTQPAVQPTAYQPGVQPTAVQSPVQPTTVQGAVPNGWGAAAGLQPTTVQQAGGLPGGGGGGDGTQVLFLGDDAWQVPGGPDGTAQANPYGYQEAQRRRRMWLIGGIGAGTAVAVAIIVIVASSTGGSPGTNAADQTRVTTPPPSPTAPATATAAAPASPTAAASPTVSATPPASVLSDGQSGLSYSQLSTPWQAGCPSDLASAFSWTAGEAAVAGQINGGQTTWYGEACSGPLPAQYNYSGPSDLENTATNVASTLGNAYYTALAHTSAPVLSQPVSVSGHPGWEIEYELTYTNAAAQGATWTTEEGAVEVVDTGTGNTAEVFFASVPNTLGATTVDSLVSSLQLNVVPNPSGSPGDAGSPAPGGTPATDGTPGGAAGGTPGDAQGG